MLYIKDIKIDKIWSLLSKNSKPSGKGSKQLSTTQNVSVLVEVCTKCFESTVKKREQFVLSGKHKGSATGVHIQVRRTGT